MDRRIAMLSLFALLPALAVAENRNQSGWLVLGTAPGSIEQTFIEEDAFPLTRELFEQSYARRTIEQIGRGLRVAPPAMKQSFKPLDLVVPIMPVVDRHGESQPIDAPIHFDAPPTLAAATLLR